MATNADRARGIRRVLLVTLALNLVVAAAKVAYGIFAGSLAIRADGFHSASDGLNNVVLLVGTWLAARPADREHPYGHQKLEVFAAAGVGAGLLLVAVDVGRDVISRALGTAPPPRIDLAAFAILGGTLAMNIGVTLWEAREGRRLQSPALISDAAHTRSDVVVTLGVAAAALLTRVGITWADSVAGAIVAVVIAITGVRIVKENANYLIDTNLVDVARIATVAKAIDGVCEARDVRSRGSPGGVFVDLTITVDGASRVDEAHARADRVEEAVAREVPGVIGVHVHVEPA